MEVFSLSYKMSEYTYREYKGWQIAHLSILLQIKKKYTATWKAAKKKRKNGLNMLIQKDDYIIT